MQKYIKEVFSDYKENNNLIDAEIENINLYKKLNKLQVKVVSLKAINLQEIQSFENYLIDRFKVNKASLDINYKDVEINQNLLENWENVINFIAKKEPISTAFLKGSTLEIDNQNVDVKLAIKGASFLKKHLIFYLFANFPQSQSSLYFLYLPVLSQSAFVVL